MAGRRLRGLLLAFAALLGAGHGGVPGDFELEDALYDLSTKQPTPKGPRKPAGGTGFDLADYFDTPLETTTKPAKPTPKPFPRPGKPDNSFWDVIRTTTTKQPKTTRAPPKHKPAKDPMDFDLADALDDKNDGKDAGRPDVRPGEAFSDDDLAGIVDGGYSPDKNKEALQLQLPPGQMGPASPLPLQKQTPAPAPREGTSLPLPSTMRPPMVETRRKTSSNRISLRVCEDPQH